MRPLEAAEPRTVGPYRLIAELGRGGMGRVLLAAGPDGRLVALKQLRAQFVADDGFRARFRREVEASRRVSGAYTAAVIDADPNAPEPWLASVFVAGPSLREAVSAAGALPEDSVLRLAAGLATALVEIHQAGLVHRDLKPSNVLLTDDGLRVIDFGIVRATDNADDGQMTHTGWLVGSPGFMSPEQAEGQPASPASDVFSLGVVLAAACTGRDPFTGPSIPQTLYNVVHANPDLSGVPVRLRPIIDGCLAKDPARRPTPAQLLRSIGPIAPSSRPWPPAVHQLIARQHAELVGLLHGATEPATGPATLAQTLVQPFPPVEPESPLVRRRSAIVVGAAIAVVVAVAATVVVLGLGNHGYQGTAVAAQSSVSVPPTQSTPESTVTTTEPSTTGINPGTWYQITNVNSGKCVDASNGGTTDGTVVLQWTCVNGRVNQEWQFVPTSGGYYEVVSRNAPALGWDVTGGPSATADGTPVQLWTYGGGTNQQWKPVSVGNGQFEFVVQSSGSCLDVTGVSTSDATRLQQWSCVGNGAQVFTLSAGS